MIDAIVALAGFLKIAQGFVLTCACCGERFGFCLSVSTGEAAKAAADAGWGMRGASPSPHCPDCMASTGLDAQE